VITDVMGLSGRRMIEAIVAGESDPMRFAELAHRGSKRRRGISWSKRFVAE
jgi:hypothetical protein